MQTNKDRRLLHNNLDFLCCPNCKGQLNQIDSTIKCNSCGKSFSEIPELKIIDFLEEIQEDTPGNDYSVAANVNLLYKTAADLQTRIDFFNSRFKHNFLNSKLSEYFLQQKKVLEIGCGTLMPLLRIASSYHQEHLITGVDVSLPLLALARDHFPSAGLYRGDASMLPFADNSFEIIWARHMLYHTEDPRRVVDEAERCLINDGVFCATTNSLINKEEMHAFHRELLKRHNIEVGKSERDSARFSAEEGEALLKKKFAHTVTIPYEGVFRFENISEFTSYYMSTGYFKRFVSSNNLNPTVIKTEVMELAEKLSVETLSNNGALILGTSSHSTFNTIINYLDS